MQFRPIGEWRQKAIAALGITEAEDFGHDYKDDTLCSMLGDSIEDSEVLIECHEEALDRIFQNLNAVRLGTKSSPTVPVKNISGSVKRSRRDSDDEMTNDVNALKRFRDQHIGSA